MKKLLVYLDDETHIDLKELAHRQKTTMSELVRYALDKTFEDALDVIGADRAHKEYVADPSSARPLRDVLKEIGVELPGHHIPAGRARVEETASTRGGKDRARPAGARGKPTTPRSDEARGNSETTMAN